MSLNKVTLVLDVYDGSEHVVARGNAALTPNVQLTAAADNELIIQAPVYGNFGASQPPAVELVATDNTDITPAGWAWTVRFINTPGNPAAFSFYLPFSDGETQYLSQVTQAQTAPALEGLMPVPTGTPTAGYVPTATGDGEASVWGPNGTGGSGYPATPAVSGTPAAGDVLTAVSPTSATWQAPAAGGGDVDSVTAGDGSIVVGGTGANPTVETGTLDVIATLHPPAASVPMNGKKLTGLGNGSASGDSVAFGQLGSAAFEPTSAFDASGAAAAAQSAAEASAAGLYVPLADVGADSGVASLDSGGHVPAGQLPAATTGAQGAVKLDGTAGDIQPVGATAAVGSTGKAADAGHVHVGLLPANNLSDVGSAATARTNLGLGSAATQSSAAFDPAGAAATAQSNAESFAEGLQPTSGSPLPTTVGGTGVSAVSAAALLADLGAAPLASPALTGTPTAPTAAALTDDTQIASTAYADSAVSVEKTRAEAAEALLAPLASPALTGNPTAPTQTAGNNSTRVATTAFVTTAASAAQSAAEAASDPSGSAATAQSNAEAFALPKAGGTMTGWLGPKVVTLTDAASTAINAAAGNVFEWALGGNHTLAAPSNPVSGQVILIDVQQPASGGPFTPAFATGAGGYSFGTDGQPTWSTAASAVDEVAFRYSSLKGMWLCQGWKLGF